LHRTIVDLLTDLVENAHHAGASIITVSVKQQDAELLLCVGDNGCGMDEAALSAAKDPFYTEAGKHPGRKTGLGIPFVMQTVETVNGSFDIRSEPGTGTSVYFSLDTGHIDCPPMGDLVEAFLSCMLFEGDYEVFLSREYQGRGYSIERSALIETLQELESAGSIAMAREYIASQESALLEDAAFSRE
jgi:hypothetical protein